MESPYNSDWPSRADPHYLRERRERRASGNRPFRPTVSVGPLHPECPTPEEAATHARNRESGERLLNVPDDAPGVPLALDRSLEEGDAALARRAAEREPDAWTSIYGRYHRPIYRYARARVGSTAAEDVTAEIFASAVQSIAKYSGQRPLLAWLYGIAKHRVADHHRRVRPRESLLERVTHVGSRGSGDIDVASAIELLGSSAGDPGASAELLDVAPALGRLTGDQREVLVLRHFVGLTTAEIATLLNRQAAAIYSLEARALARLRKDLA